MLFFWVMGKSESFEFQDLSKESSMNDVHAGSKKTGCYVSIVTGFVLTLLAACLVVVVGLIVHFTTAGRTIDCKCSYPGYSGGATSNPATTQKPVLEQCKDLVNSGNKEICEYINILNVWKKQCCQFLEYILRLICFVNWILEVFNHILVYLFYAGNVFNN